MLFALAVADGVNWYGPVTVTFPVQFPGDPFDATRNDVRVRFIGDKNQREERMAYFDPVLGAWRATLSAQQGGSYRAVLVRNGREALVEPNEGIVDLQRDSGLGILSPQTTASHRLAFDTGDAWIGVGADLGDSITAEKVEVLATKGANWVRVAFPSDPLSEGVLDRFSDAMDAIERRGLFFTVAVPESCSTTWRRYILSRFGSSPRLVQWESTGELSDPWSRATSSTAGGWEGLFENLPGPFVVPVGDFERIKALRAVVDASGLMKWATPRTWTGQGAKGVAESDRMILVAFPNAKLTGVPLADGIYDLTTIDPATGESKTGETKVEHGALPLAGPHERFFVLRRKL